jgi:hypothetical protein
MTTLNQIDWNDGALSTLKVDGGWNIVRKTLDGMFAVIVLSGGSRKIVNVLPTLQRARAYNFAISGETM